MAYDLLQIAPERKIPTIEPAWIVWFCLLVVVVGGGALAEMHFWKGSSTAQPLWFWSSVLVFPLIAWSVLFLLYLGMLQAPRINAQDYNSERRAYLHNLLREACAVVDKQLGLNPTPRFVGDDTTVTARWLQADRYAWRFGDTGADAERQRHLLPWVFDVLMARILPGLIRLPASLPVQVLLHVVSSLPRSEVENIWSDNWTRYGWRTAIQSKFIEAPPKLIDVDAWLGGYGDLAIDAATVVCIVQLNDLLECAPDEGLAEAAVILLLAPPLLTKRKRLSPLVLLHRPEARADGNLDQALHQALLWGKTEGNDIVDQWMSGGGNDSLHRALTSCMDQRHVAIAQTPQLAGQHDIDQQIGRGGAASEWLCVALAAEHAHSSGKKQLLSLVDEQQMTLAVLAPLMWNRDSE